MYTVDPQHVEGEMTVGAKRRSNLGEPEFNTLDEPIKDTIVSERCYNFPLWFKESYRIVKPLLFVSRAVEGRSSGRQEIFPCFIS